MKKWMCIIAWFCLAAVLLPGCQTKEPESTEPIITWDNIPQLTYGQMEYEKLTALPWYSGRCEATSLNRMSETEQGFYLSFLSTLYYADKTDYSFWIPVCGKPDCDHLSDCDARLMANQFIIRNSRIFYEADILENQHLYDGIGNGIMLLSMASNGTDKRFEYALDEAMCGSSGGYLGSLLTADSLILWCSELQNDGTSSLRAFYITENTTKQLSSKTGIEPGAAYENFQLAARKLKLRGDQYIYDAVTNLPEVSAFRFNGDEKIKLDISQLPSDGAYISGTTLRYFVPNDGYYDRNMDTGAEVRLADARLAGSTCDMVLPNCIIESNFIGSSSIKNRPDDMVPAIEIFDGKLWYNVALPCELSKIDKNEWLSVLGVTSDSILLGIQNAEKYDTTGLRVYRIQFASAKWQLEYQCEILPPHVINYIERMESIKAQS